MLAEMEGAIDANAPLDYAEFQLFPSQDRYEACVCSGKKIETIASGLLTQLALHSPEIKDLSSRGSNGNFKLQPPKSLDSRQWFTKSTLTSFLHLVGSLDILNTARAIDDEITQLEEARKFHLSLYTKDSSDLSGDGTRDSSNMTAMGPKLKDEVKISSSDASKNELLRAMELRLKVLRGELTAAFNRATGATCSPKHIFDIEKLSQHFGAIDLRNTLRKFVEHSQMYQNVDLPSDEKSPTMADSRNDGCSETKANAQILKPSLLDTPVKYSVSPAKAAQVERQSSTESEESSVSSDDNQPTVERSRTLIRSASPRRSASPMRRVQIGRSGSRRATALNIKSLNYFPARDKTFSNRDATANSSEDEGSEHPPKRSDSNVGRISVQDAISLFENRQKDQTSDVQRRRSTLAAFPGTEKSVLRRWSAGTGETSTQENPQIASENSVPITSDHSETGEIPRNSLEVKDEPEFFSGDNNPAESSKMDAQLDTYEERASNSGGGKADILIIHGEVKTEKLASSAEWNQQKELELNQMLRKMMECKPVRYQTTAPATNRRSQDVPSERKRGVSDHYKGKRDEKQKGETAGKLAEKAQPRATQKILGERKTGMTAASKSFLAKPQKSLKTVTQSVNPKKESLKPAVTKKAVSRTSPSPAIRKSWSTTPSPRATTGTSPAKTPCGTPSTGTTPTRRRPQPAPSVPRSGPKEETFIQQPKNVKARPNDTKKSTKDMTEKQLQPSTKNVKTVKSKVQTPGKDGSVAGAKPSFYSKVTKKSSVVPLESKPFLRKGTGIGPGVGPVVIKTKEFPQPEETLENPENLSEAQKNEVLTDSSDFVCQQQQEEFEALHANAALEPETQELCSQQKYGEIVSSEQVAANFDDSCITVTEAVFNTEVEEGTVISPTAWVEIEEDQDFTIPQDENGCEISFAANAVPVAISSPRVRHSLSQMLLEESAETDTLEWGNAENPAAMVYQKDAPKGLKRLLKFARKSKADPNLTGWSSSSVCSEGEDDAEDSKAVSKKNADNLRRMAVLHGKNYGQKKASLGESYEKDLAGPEIHSAHFKSSKFSAQSSPHKLQDHISTAATTSKATRSFFSLSAFRGSKPNETKLR